MVVVRTAPSYVIGGAAVTFVGHGNVEDAGQGFADFSFVFGAGARSADGIRVSLPAGDFVIARDLSSVWVTPRNEVDDLRYLARQIVPFVSALHGRLVLHASANRFGDSVIAFNGPSGVGKSTIAALLDRAGHPIVSDDLLPVRREGQRFVVPTSRQALALTAIAFPRRGAALERAELSHRQGLESLLLHGFGEHEIPDLNRWQFESYHDLAGACDLMDLVVPNDLAQLIDAIPLIALLARSREER